MPCFNLLVLSACRFCVCVTNLQHLVRIYLVYILCAVTIKVICSNQNQRNALGKCCNDAAQWLNLNQILLKSQNNEDKKWFLTLKSKYAYLQPECLLYHSILGCALDGFQATRLLCYAIKMILAALSYSVKESVKQGAGFFFGAFSAAYKSLFTW